uniref:Uncharacterized protein n=1 Tax=Arundo donax TaxID=35708 RepID=A0A0A8Z0P1_ARUDO
MEALSISHISPVFLYPVHASMADLGGRCGARVGERRDAVAGLRDAAGGAGAARSGGRGRRRVARRSSRQATRRLEAGKVSRFLSICRQLRFFAPKIGRRTGSRVGRRSMETRRTTGLAPALRLRATSPGCRLRRRRLASVVSGQSQSRTSLVLWH